MIPEVALSSESCEVLSASRFMWLLVAFRSDRESQYLARYLPAFCQVCVSSMVLFFSSKVASESPLQNVIVFLSNIILCTESCILSPLLYSVAEKQASCPTHNQREAVTQDVITKSEMIETA